MKISIVTPSFNQATHLRQTLESVLSQEVPGLEYIVVDGGSTDGSREILEEYGDRLAWWCSEPDGGQYAAINKGFSHATGDVLAWLNSSDFYLPWTLRSVLTIFESFPRVEWISSLHKTCVEEDGNFAGYQKLPGFSRNAFCRGLHGSRENPEFIQQETCFWRRSLWEKAGAAIPSTHPTAADFHLWSLFFQHAPLTGVAAPLAAFRFHDEQRSAASTYLQEVEQILDDLRKDECQPAHHRVMPIIHRNPDRSTAGQAGSFWLLNWMENDNFLFEMRDPEASLSQKEAMIVELASACEERLQCINQLQAQLAAATEKPHRASWMERWFARR
jgi:hypothetical protein